MNVVTQVHDDVGIIAELPVGCKTRIKAGSRVGVIVEEHEGLVSGLQDDVVVCGFLLLEIQVVDIFGSTDNKCVLMA